MPAGHALRGLEGGWRSNQGKNGEGGKAARQGIHGRKLMAGHARLGMHIHDLCQAQHED